MTESFASNRIITAINTPRTHATSDTAAADHPGLYSESVLLARARMLQQYELYPMDLTAYLRDGNTVDAGVLRLSAAPYRDADWSARAQQSGS